MNINEVIEYWVKGAEEDIKTAESLFAAARYPHCLFFCYLLIEKMSKALATKKTGKPAPYGHNLLRFAEISGLKFSKTQLDFFDEINTFNIEARYNDYKFQFYKKATKRYAGKYFKKAAKCMYG